MAAPNECVCTLSIRDLLGDNVTSAELVCLPRRSYLSNGNLITAAPKRATITAGVCTLSLPESATAGTKVVFQVQYVQNDQVYDILSEPVTIPNQASLDLSTVFTVNRG
jgi:hypothetical protein